MTTIAAVQVQEEGIDYIVAGCDKLKTDIDDPTFTENGRKIHTIRDSNFFFSSGYDLSKHHLRMNRGTLIEGRHKFSNDLFGRLMGETKSPGINTHLSLFLDYIDNVDTLLPKQEIIDSAVFYSECNDSEFMPKLFTDLADKRFPLGEIFTIGNMSITPEQTHFLFCTPKGEMYKGLCTGSVETGKVLSLGAGEKYALTTLKNTLPNTSKDYNLENAANAVSLSILEAGTHKDAHTAGLRMYVFGGGKAYLFDFESDILKKTGNDKLLIDHIKDVSTNPNNFLKIRDRSFYRHLYS